MKQNFALYHLEQAVLYVIQERFPLADSDTLTELQEDGDIREEAKRIITEQLKNL